jgi:DNA-binding NtrC family response regulator
VRELAHTLERAAIESGFARIEREHVDAQPVDAHPAHGRMLLEVDELSIEAVERALIARVLEEAGGNRSRAARTLGVHRATLYGKLHALGFSAKAG